MIKILVDMEGKKFVGEVEWSFIFDMENILPDQADSEMIILNQRLLSRIPPQWNLTRQFLEKYLGKQKEIHLAVSEVYEKGKAYTISGTLKKGPRPLGYHKMIFFDYHRLFSHYITAVITNEKGNFRFSFDQSFLHHHRRGIKEKTLPVPDLIIKIFAWRDRKFRLIKKKAIELDRKKIKITTSGQMKLRLGDLILPD